MAILVDGVDDGGSWACPEIDSDISPNLGVGVYIDFSGVDLRDQSLLASDSSRVEGSMIYA